MNNLVIRGQDGFALAATPIDQQTTRIPLLKHVKGALIIHGSGGGTVPLNSRFVAHRVAQGWARLQKGAPAKRIAREPGTHFPAREELGDLDQAKWPIGPGGEPSDPWVLTCDLYLTSLPDGRDMIFTTNNVTGRTAVEEFSRAVVWQRLQQGMDAKPIIELGSANVFTQFGPIAVPKITIVDWWKPGEGGAPAAAMPDPAPGPASRTISSRPRRAQGPTAAPTDTAMPEVLDDEIPF